MQNFLMITKIDIEPLLLSLKEHEELWNMHPIRTAYPKSAHSEVYDIVIRYPNINDTAINIFNNDECDWFPAAFVLPVMQYIYELSQITLGSRIGRCAITRIKPGCKVAAHIDEGTPSEYYQRFHICLQNEPGAIFMCGNEELTPIAGDVFIIANHKMHSVINNSTKDRLTMIVDIRTPLFEHIKATT